MRSLSPRWSPPDVTLAASAVFFVCFALVHYWFWARGNLVDWPVYKTYGDAIVHHGLVPYRDFPLEYPPGALPVFIVPSIAGDYARVLEALMAACGVGLIAVVAPVRPAAALYVALAPVLAGSLILSRFDLWPALLATAALAALLQRRHTLGWGLLGLAVAAKLWPLVLVPPALGWSAVHGRIRSALAGVVTLALVVLPFAVLAPHGLFESVRRQLDRPLQIESIAASLLTTFAHPTVSTSHGSQNIAGHGTLAATFGIVQVLVLVALWGAFLRGPIDGERFVRYSAASVCAFVAFGKVLSPQFLLWLVPLVPLVRGRRGLVAAALLTAALVLTQVWFPMRYWSYAQRFDLAGVVLARDLVLVALVAALAWPARMRWL
ncbi:MAG TPA: glycosyltransferase 87 family protein [Gaiellaceae bacterium]|nr:glycosyltransferase 87 family protein [Gaiellaceae bacterium]